MPALAKVLELVERMLGQHRQLAARKSDRDRPAIERLGAASAPEIDRPMQELCGLT